MQRKIQVSSSLLKSVSHRRAPGRISTARDSRVQKGTPAAAPTPSFHCAAADAAVNSGPTTDNKTPDAQRTHHDGALTRDRMLLLASCCRNVGDR